MIPDIQKLNFFMIPDFQKLQLSKKTQKLLISWFRTPNSWHSQITSFVTSSKTFQKLRFRTPPKTPKFMKFHWFSYFSLFFTLQNLTGRLP
jgi:hypothetical protein